MMDIPAFRTANCECMLDATMFITCWMCACQSSAACCKAHHWLRVAATYCRPHAAAAGPPSGGTCALLPSTIPS